MVRSGARQGQVISSGRQPGTAKLTHGKKGTHQRKIARFNADSCCSIQSDSESQAETVQGLDGCASLLRDILKNEDSGSEILSSKSRYNYRPLDCKKCSSKKKEHQKRSAPSVVRKEILSLDNKKLIPNEASTGSKRDMLDIAQSWSLQDHYRMYSPIIYQALCEHVQTQMSLMNNLSSKDGPNGIPTVPCHTVSGSDSVDSGAHSGHGCSTSASVRSPQQLSCPLTVHSEVQTDGDNQLGSQVQSSSVNCPGVPRNLFNICPGIACSLPYTDKAAIPAFQQLSLANWILPQQRVPQEADLLKCFQTQMSLFPSHGKETLLDSQAQQSPIQSQSAFVTANEEQVGKATNEAKCLNIHVQDAKIAKNVQMAKTVNKIAEKVRTVKYLLGELQALVGEQKDSEVQRLVTEVEACVSELSQVSDGTDVQVEIALAMQPLRSENAQLRRQLRILNQHLREQEKTPEIPGNLELFSLQSLNISLHNQLQESLKSQELLRSKNEELLQVIENQRDENKKFTSLFKDKEQTLLQNKQQFDIEMTRVKMDLEEALANEKNSQFKLETTEKENQILGITLRQRDAEVTRLRELTRTLQSSMAKLLSDISVDTARHKRGNNLTKSLLDIYDKQFEQDPTLPHTSIMSYLDHLETNHSLTHSELLSTVRNEATREPDRFYEHVLPSQDPPHGDTRAEDGGLAPGPVPTFLEQSSDTECETVTLIEEDCNLDSTLYIPFARNSSKKHSPPVCKRVSPQPKISTATTQLTSNSAVASKRENKLYAPRVSSSQNGAEDAPAALPRPSDSKDMQLLRKIKEAIGKIPVAAEDPKEQAAHHDPSAFPGPGVQAKGSIVCDGSFLNSDLMSDWSISSFSTFTSHDEQDFRNGLAALDANIARLQKSLKTGLLEK